MVAPSQIALLVAAAQRTGKAKRPPERAWLWRRQRSRRAGEEMPPQHLAPGVAGLQVKRVDDGETKAAGRHGVVLGFLVLVKRDLHARDARQVPHLCRERGRRVAVAWPCGPNSTTLYPSRRS